MKLGILAESTRQMNLLYELVHKSGHHVAEAVLARASELDNLTSARLRNPDIWVARMDEDSVCFESILSAIDAEHMPLMYDDPVDYDNGVSVEAAKRFGMKVQSCLVEHSAPTSKKTAKKVWVLAASTGGPEAVAQFLSKLDRPLTKTALVYVQHINVEMLPSLMVTLRRNTKMPVVMVDKPVPVCENTIYVISPRLRVEVSDFGGFLLTDSAWSGSYSPSANQVMAKVAKIYGANAGVIVFSGMGDDGAAASRLVKRAGASLWLQTLASCTIDSMPKCVLATGCADFVGTPVELAEKLIASI